MLLSAVIIVLCIAGNKLSAKIGVPGLIVFLGLGMLFGSDGLLKIPFDDFIASEKICCICLIFIMFCGGFSTNWEAAKPVALRAGILSSLGTILTALITTMGCHFLIGMELKESFLIGAVISSTDAASVFSILRSKKLNLKGGLASLLEIESGSNDPFSYMLTIIALALMGTNDISNLGVTALFQVLFGVLFGFGIAFIAVWFLRRTKIAVNGFDTIFMIAIIFAAYSAPAMIGGNGYLSVYIAGIFIGNNPIKHKAELVHFFDGITGLCQILLFFILGLLSNPSQLPQIVLPALAIFLILTFASRPVATFIICSKGYNTRERLFVAWAGLRGASSIVFAITAVVSPSYGDTKIFNIVMCVCLISVAFQGTLLPFFAKKLGLIDDGSSVMKTFNDYQDETPQFNMMRVYVSEEHSWCGKKISEIKLPEESLVLMIKRRETTIVPKGETVIESGDDVIMSIPSYYDNDDIALKEEKIDKSHKWVNKKIAEIDLPSSYLIIMVKREGETIIPNGSTTILLGDTLVVNEQN